jgi:hypothetical protein
MRFPRFAVLVAVCGLVGCKAAKLNEDKAFTLSPSADEYLLELVPQKGDQTVSAAVTATEPVDVYVVLKSAAADPRDLKAGDREKKAVAFKKGVKAETLTAKIPAGEGASVLVALPAAGKKADVTVKLTN